MRPDARRLAFDAAAFCCGIAAGVWLAVTALLWLGVLS